MNNNSAGHFKADKKFSYKCSMCDKTLLSREGIAIHLRAFHGVTAEILADLYSLVINPNPSGRQFKVFVPPTKVPRFGIVAGASCDMERCGTDIPQNIFFKYDERHFPTYSVTNSIQL